MGLGRPRRISEKVLIVVVRGHGWSNRLLDVVVGGESVFLLVRYSFGKWAFVVHQMAVPDVLQRAVQPVLPRQPFKDLRLMINVLALIYSKCTSFQAQGTAVALCLACIKQV